MIAIGVVTWFFAWQQGNKVMIGDAQAGVAELRPDARYNQDAVLISRKFALGVDILNVIVEAGPSACTTSFKAMETIDRFAWHMGNVEGVEQVMTLPMAAKLVNAGGTMGPSAARPAARPRHAAPGHQTSRPILDCSTPIAAPSRSRFTSDHQSPRLTGRRETQRFRTENKHTSDFARKRDAAVKRAGRRRRVQHRPGELRLATGSLGVRRAVTNRAREGHFSCTCLRGGGWCVLDQLPRIRAALCVLCR